MIMYILILCILNNTETPTIVAKLYNSSSNIILYLNDKKWPVSSPIERLQLNMLE